MYTLYDQTRSVWVTLVGTEAGTDDVLIELELVG